MLSRQAACMHGRQHHEAAALTSTAAHTQGRVPALMSCLALPGEGVGRGAPDLRRRPRQHGAAGDLTCRWWRCISLTLLCMARHGSYDDVLPLKQPPCRDGGCRHAAPPPAPPGAGAMTRAGAALINRLPQYGSVLLTQRLGTSGELSCCPSRLTQVRGRHGNVSIISPAASGCDPEPRAITAHPAVPPLPPPAACRPPRRVDRRRATQQPWHCSAASAKCCLMWTPETRCSSACRRAPLARLSWPTLLFPPSR